MSAQPIYELVVHDPETDTTGFLVIDSLGPGLAAGGLRMAPDVDLQVTRELARLMSYKYPSMGIQLGGAKGAIVGDPSAPDARRKQAAYARLVAPLLKSCCLLGEDLGIDGDAVQHLYAAIQHDPVAQVDAHLARRGVPVAAFDAVEIAHVTSAEFGRELTGYGMAEAVAEACAALGLPLAQATVAVQGFGTVGSVTARRLAEQGARIVAVADRHGTIAHAGGLSIEALSRAADAFGAIDRGQLPEQYRRLGHADWLSCGADILIPAAIAGAIHRENQQRVSARAVIEGANMAIAEDVEAALHARGIVVVPDFIANAGSAAGFGMLITAECPPSQIFEQVGLRIRAATTAVLGRLSASPSATPRAAAVEFVAERVRASKAAAASVKC